ncbi:phytanoyl-CoA dioxygenase family protein [Ramlibacter sp.]|uniref:phytanoyl-CoA dioxygenase family protein n=1 Tax=Ramlibacter sp. TaxID=1917967 RepID=UPI00185E9A0A|nr:phytanoyl-CoA dioxygenase family protein [Ramlibacter sp.]MBA2675704.1 phytanoyl-CoA dioxygenase family protein [Ramlibacter sp.]
MTTESLSIQGFACVAGVLLPEECKRLAAHLDTAASALAGTRQLLSHAWCRALAKRLRTHPQLTGTVPVDDVAVQCTYFSKSVNKNWLVPVHQDLSIPVAEKVEAPGFHAWSIKEGGVFVQPPTSLLERLVAVRVHLDPCAESDGPLQVVPGSHLQGALAPARAHAVRDQSGTVTCALGIGDALVMRPLLLHASSKAGGASARRVLHFLFAPRELPHGLRWPHAI